MKLMSNLKENLADYYTALVLVIGVPGAVGLLAGIEWGVLLSFVTQAVIGVLYIKGSK